MGSCSDVLHTSQHGHRRLLAVDAGRPAGQADEPNAADLKVPEASTSEGCGSSYVPGCDSKLGRYNTA
jgi:hypothetical protein